jgi:hypothetical protein
MTDTNTAAPVDSAQLPKAPALDATSVARVVLGGVVLWLVQHGYIAANQQDQVLNYLAAALVAAGTYAWIWWKNRKAVTLAHAALNSPPPSAPTS